MLSRTACAICLAVWATGARGADAGAPARKIPRAPPSTPDPILARQCAKQIRAPASAADRAVAAAGWMLLGASQRFGETEVVGGQSGFDGMCRPLGYQFFVFSGGRFAGTFSPVPMDARTDGSCQLPQVVSAGDLTVPFSRYAPSDPLCCPSRITTVQFQLQKGPVLVATSASTAPTGEPKTLQPPAGQLR
jgi:hypothetical protein